MRLDPNDVAAPEGVMSRVVGRMGEPVVRTAMRQAMRIMGHQFVMGRSIDEALQRSRSGDNAAYRYSFDMLGEGALTAALVPTLHEEMEKKQRAGAFVLVSQVNMRDQCGMH